MDLCIVLFFKGSCVSSEQVACLLVLIGGCTELDFAESVYFESFSKSRRR